MHSHYSSHSLKNLSCTVLESCPQLSFQNSKNSSSSTHFFKNRYFSCVLFFPFSVFWVYLLFVLFCLVGFLLVYLFLVVFDLISMKSLYQLKQSHCHKTSMVGSYPKLSSLIIPEYFSKDLEKLAQQKDYFIYTLRMRERLITVPHSTTSSYSIPVRDPTVAAGHLRGPSL